MAPEVSAPWMIVRQRAISFLSGLTHHRNFISPSQVLANQRYNEKADIFSYGIILWELLTRTCPYEGMNAVRISKELI